MDDPLKGNALQKDSTSPPGGSAVGHSNSFSPAPPKSLKSSEGFRGGWRSMLSRCSENKWPHGGGVSIAPHIRGFRLKPTRKRGMKAPSGRSLHSESRFDLRLHHHVSDLNGDPTQRESKGAQRMSMQVIRSGRRLLQACPTGRNRVALGARPSGTWRRNREQKSGLKAISQVVGSKWSKMDVVVFLPGVMRTAHVE